MLKAKRLDVVEQVRESPTRSPFGMSWRVTGSGPCLLGSSTDSSWPSACMPTLATHLSRYSCCESLSRCVRSHYQHRLTWPGLTGDLCCSNIVQSYRDLRLTLTGPCRSSPVSSRRCSLDQSSATSFTALARARSTPRRAYSLTSLAEVRRADPPSTAKLCG